MLKKKQTKITKSNYYSLVLSTCMDYNYSRISEEELLSIISPYNRWLKTLDTGDMVGLLYCYPKLIAQLDHVSPSLLNMISEYEHLIHIKKIDINVLIKLAASLDYMKYEQLIFLYNKLYDFEQNNTLSHQDIFNLIKANPCVGLYFSSIPEEVALKLIASHHTDSRFLHLFSPKDQVEYMKRRGGFMDLQFFESISPELYDYALSQNPNVSLEDMSSLQLLEIPKELIFKYYHNFNIELKYNYVMACITYSKRVDSQILNFIHSQENNPSLRSKIRALANYKNDAELILNILEN